MDMQRLHKYLSYEWASIYADFLSKAEYNNGYFEAIGYSYKFSPATSMIMSYDSSIFDLRKAAAMYFWYKKADPTDYSIIEYFMEYAHCVDDVHRLFNSNYGIYAYRERGLERCINVLKKDKTSRQATLCINNNDAMGPDSIDKLCTNTLQFFIRDNKLQMIIQMRSSNFITLLPYDAFMFSVFYFQVYYTLCRHYSDLQFGHITMQVATLHAYEKDVYNIKKTEWLKWKSVGYNDHNWQLNLEREMLNTLMKNNHDSGRIYEETQREDS